MTNKIKDNVGAIDNMYAYYEDRDTESLRDKFNRAKLTGDQLDQLSNKNFSMFEPNPKTKLTAETIQQLTPDARPSISGSMKTSGGIVTGKLVPAIDIKLDNLNESQAIRDVIEHIRKTYGEHYNIDAAQNPEPTVRPKQALDFIVETLGGTDFIRANILKYLVRYGKKDGKNKKDLLKLCHYAILLLHYESQSMDKNNS